MVDVCLLEVLETADQFLLPRHVLLHGEVNVGVALAQVREDAHEVAPRGQDLRQALQRELVLYPINELLRLVLDRVEEERSVVRWLIRYTTSSSS